VRWRLIDSVYRWMRRKEGTKQTIATRSCAVSGGLTGPRPHRAEDGSSYATGRLKDLVALWHSCCSTVEGLSGTSSQVSELVAVAAVGAGVAA
jgi:hypothetical protein